MKLQLPFIFFIILAGSGCTPVAKMMIGYKEPTTLSYNDVRDWATHGKLTNVPVYSLDSSYSTYLKSVYVTDHSYSRKNLNQFIMVMYFRNDSLISLINNCMVPGFPNLKWNKYGSFDSLPPKTVYADTLFNKIRLSQLNKCLTPIQQPVRLNNTGEFLILFANHVFNRQSKRLIKLINKKYTSPTLPLVIINNDNFLFQWQQKTW